MSMLHRMRCGLVGASVALASFCSAQTITPQEHARRANDYLKAKQPDKAIPEFAALVAAEPDNVDAEANLGVLLYFQGNYAQAEGPLRKAVELKPELAKIRGLLGICEYQLGHLDAARGDLWGALNSDLDPKFHKEVGLTLVEVDTARNDLPSTAVTIGKLLETAPADPEILYAAYRVHSDLAGEALLSLSLAAPKSGQMQQAIAHELERVRDLTGAVASFRKAIAANPNLPGVHFELAEALHSSDSQEVRAQAEAEYKLALARNPHEVQAAVRLGDIAVERGDLAGGKQLYERALKDQPGNSDAAMGLARMYSQQNEDEKALPLLLDVLKEDPSNILVHFRLSAVYRKMKRPEDARRELAEYQRYKAMKEGLKQVYSAMKIEAPHRAADDAGAAH